MKIIIIFISFIFSISLYSQDARQTHIQHPTDCETVYYNIQFWNIANDTLQKYSKSNEYYDYVKALNNTFEGACIQFILCKIDTIHDYNYYQVKDDLHQNEVKDLVNMYYNKYAINIYHTKDNTYETINGICKEPKDKPYIMIDFLKGTPPIVNYTKLRRQMLLYFGMPFLSSTDLSKELVNGSNSTTTADSTWDTPSDPANVTLPLPVYGPRSLSYFYSYNKDANGDYYNPMIGNLMSDLYKLTDYGSRCAFLTKGQYDLLIKKESQCRKIRWGL